MVLGMPHCNERFEGIFSMLKWDEKATNMIDIAASTYLQCPKCFGRIEQSQRHAQKCSKQVCGFKTVCTSTDMVSW